MEPIHRVKRSALPTIMRVSPRLNQATMIVGLMQRTAITLAFTTPITTITTASTIARIIGRCMRVVRRPVMTTGMMREVIVSGVSIRLKTSVTTHNHKQITFAA